MARFRKLSYWNKVGVIGAVASTLSLLIAVCVFVLPRAPNTVAKTPSSDKDSHNRSEGDNSPAIGNVQGNVSISYTNSQHVQDDGDKDITSVLVLHYAIVAGYMGTNYSIYRNEDVDVEDSEIVLARANVLRAYSLLKLDAKEYEHYIYKETGDSLRIFVTSTAITAISEIHGKRAANAARFGSHLALAYGLLVTLSSADLDDDEQKRTLAHWSRRMEQARATATSAKLGTPTLSAINSISLTAVNREFENARAETWRLIGNLMVTNYAEAWLSAEE